jgi:hypothetical protein
MQAPLHRKQRQKPVAPYDPCMQYELNGAISQPSSHPRSERHIRQRSTFLAAL